MLGLDQSIQSSLPVLSYVDAPRQLTDAGSRGDDAGVDGRDGRFR